MPLLRSLLSKLLVLLLLIWGHMASANYVVSGAGETDADGTYEAWTLRDGVQAYRKTTGSQTWYLYRCFGRWVIEPYTDCFEAYYYIPSTSATPPASGWRGWPSPMPTVAIAGPSITSVNKLFIENIANNGQVSNTLLLTHNLVNGDGFTGVVGEDFIETNKAVVENLPTGLTARVVFQASDTVVFSLSGTATSASQINNVTNLTLSFNDAAFISGSASANANAVINDFRIQYRDEITVGASGQYTTIAAAIAAAGQYDILNLAAETFTARNVTINKNIVLNGAGANATIIEAMAVPQAENGRIFLISFGSNEIVIKNVTLRNGNLVGGNSDGGAIRAISPLTLENCRLTNNRTVSSGVGTAGAVAADLLTMHNCTVDNNTAIRTDNGVQAAGGAIYLNTGVITNSTFTANSLVTNNPSDDARGGAIIATTQLTMINSTVVGNSITGIGGGVILIGNSLNNSFINSIIYGNTASVDPTSADVSYFANTPVSFQNSIVGFKSEGDADSETNLMMLDPLLSPLADNGGPTPTMALASQSPAIGTGLFNASYPDLDQRGFSRSGRPDIGAYQYAATAPVYITFDSNGNSGVTPPIIGNSFSSGVTLTLPDSDVMALDGFTFLGWNTEPGGSGTQYLPGASYTVPGSNVRLYAQYQPTVPAPQVYDVTVSLTGEGVIDRDGIQQVTENDTLTLFVQASAGFEIDRTVAGTCPAGIWLDDYYTTGIIIAPCTVVVNFSEIKTRQRHLFWKIPSSVFSHAVN